MRTLTPSEARTFYDSFGAKQDAQPYEDVALAELMQHGGFDSATRVFELGCGTGRFAETLFEHRLPASASYLGVDISTTMVALARKRLERFGSRAAVTEGDALADGRFDRIVCTYVLDLLSENDIREFLVESARALAPGGRLCVANLTVGTTFTTRIVSTIWKAAFLLAPRRVGGCRPLRLAPFLNSDIWHIRHRAVVASSGIPSEVIVAEKIGS
jgi:ubiquinone/menaquinone biosynthesis C-methylase UbiE